MTNNISGTCFVCQDWLKLRANAREMVYGLATGKKEILQGAGHGGAALGQNCCFMLFWCLNSDFNRTTGR